MLPCPSTNTPRCPSKLSFPNGAASAGDLLVGSTSRPPHYTWSLNGQVQTSTLFEYLRWRALLFSGWCDKGGVG